MSAVGKAQIVNVKADTVSTIYGCYTNLSWDDLGKTDATTEYSIYYGGTAQNMTTTPLYGNFKTKSVTLTGTGRTGGGWGCFNNQYVKTAYCEIRATNGSTWSGMINVPSNYLWIGCKPMDYGIGQMQTASGVNLSWDYWTIAGAYKLEYSYGTYLARDSTNVSVFPPVTTTKPTCPNTSLSRIDGTTLKVVVTTICSPTDSSSKTCYVDFAPATSTTTSGTTTTTTTSKKSLWKRIFGGK